MKIDDSVIPCLLFLLASLLTVGVMLRILSSVVQQYATRRGAPQLAMSVRIFGLCLLAPGLLLGLGGSVYLGGIARNETEIRQSASILLVSIFLIGVTGFTWWWAREIRKPDRTGTTELGALVAQGLCYFTSVTCVAICIIAAQDSAVPLVFIPVLVLSFLLIGMLDVLLGILWGLHQRFLSLWQIYLGVRSRRPLDEEIELLSQYAWGRRRRKLKDMCEELRDGAEPEEVFDHAGLVSSLEGAQLATGLKTGKLPQVLNEILRRRTEFASQLPHMQNPIVAVLYLWLVVLVMYCVTGFISYWITPKFKRIFDDFGTELPRATKLIIQASDMFADTWVLGVPMILLALGLLTALALLPVTGGLSGLRERFAYFWPRICLPDVLRALALAAEAGIPFEEAFIPFVRRQLRVPLHNRLVRVQEIVRDGGDCWIGLGDEKLLRPAEAQFLRSAQRAGNLPWALETLSTRFEQRWQFWMLFCFEFVQPVVVLTIGLITAFIAVAYFLPLVKLINDLS